MRRNVSRGGAIRTKHRDDGTQARSLLVSLCQGTNDAAFAEQLSRLFDLTECSCTGDRPKIEAFIRETFALAYGASVRNFMPRLMAICSRDGDLLAAFGVRSAAEGNLFLEKYFDQPIEQVIEERTGSRVERAKIVEIGNLSAIYPGVVRWMIIALTIMLYGEGYEWVAFTGPPSLRNGFHRLGLHPSEICLASIERLEPEERERWGSYYDTAPSVMFGSIHLGFHAMRKNKRLLNLISGEKKSFFRVLSSGVGMSVSMVVK